MNINKTIENGCILISLEGRLDTNTAPDLEKELSTIKETDSLIFDFKNLDYISSAGLRIILILQKKLQAPGKLVIKNVNDTIKNVFEMTGFTDILNIE